MDAALTPELALRYLRELAADLVAGVVLRPDGGRLAGNPELADAAGRLLGAASPSPLAQTGHAGHLVTLARSSGHVLVAVHTRHALPGLVRHDLRVVLGDLAADGGPPAGDDATPLEAPPAALDAVVRAATAALPARRTAAGPAS